MKPLNALGAIAASAVLLAGCSSAGAETNADHGATHTMPDGTVMSGKSMKGMESGSSSKPSSAAKMVCSDDIADSIVKSLGLSKTPEHSGTWAAKIYTCSYKIGGKQLKVSVRDDTKPKVGRAYFDKLRSGFSKSSKFNGMQGLGLPSFETPDGNVVFLKDSKTLLVDATQLPAKVGEANVMSRNDLAYSAAASVVACWSEGH